MPTKVIKIHYQNGINREIAQRDIFNELIGDYQFIESHCPDFILFGPYGNDIPKPGSYTRIAYYCENIKPDMSACEWAFGIPYEEEIKNLRYKRIQWHGLDPKTLVKPSNYNAEEIYDSKKYFCNFLYSHKVSYREEFFRQLARYKKVDAPGRSMNNMQSIDEIYKGNIWERKREFLSPYKFTIAFENYSYPGYQTEKLYDAMQANSMPIYCGDPLVNSIFNTQSFINTADYIKPGNILINWFERNSQADFIDIRPQDYHNPLHRVKRKLKAIGRDTKMRLQFKNLDFKPIIERIIELDQDKNKYIQVLQQPWFNNNEPPLSASLKNRWIEIFDQQRGELK